MKLKDLDKAVEIALAAHNGQLDKGGKPYILHPIAVMSRVNGIDARIVAVLHDVVEDTKLTLKDLQPYFNDTIVNAIDAITKRKEESYEAYLDRVKSDPLALEVKLADIGHNSSLERLERLHLKERSYLENKYKKALDFLTK